MQFIRHSSQVHVMSKIKNSLKGKTVWHFIVPVKIGILSFDLVPLKTEKEIKTLVDILFRLKNDIKLKFDMFEIVLPLSMNCHNLWIT
jgi:hypothetical protein